MLTFIYSTLCSLFEYAFRYFYINNNDPILKRIILKVSYAVRVCLSYPSFQTKFTPLKHFINYIYLPIQMVVSIFFPIEFLLVLIYHNRPLRRFLLRNFQSISSIDVLPLVLYIITGHI